MHEIQLYKNFYARYLGLGFHLIRVNGAAAVVHGERNVKKFLDVYVISEWNISEDEDD